MSTIFEEADTARSYDFFTAAPTWATEAIIDAVNVPANATLSDGKLAHLRAAISCVKAVNARCTREIDTYGTGHAYTVARHKRSRSQIRAAKANSPKDSGQKKKKN